MSFWTEMRQAYAETRAAQLGSDAPIPAPEWRPVDEKPGCAECETRDAEMESLRGMLEESTSVVRELAAENERLTAELRAKEKERSNSQRGSAGNEKFRKLMTVVAKLYHPDAHATNKTLFKALTPLFQKFLAEIDRIKGE